MQSLWTAIEPGPTSTRLIVMEGASRTLLKANLRRDPQHRRALSTLLEGLALWEGMQVRAALVAGEAADSSGTNLYAEAFDDGPRTPLFTLDVVWAHRRRHRRDPLGGVADFRDLRRLLFTELAR